MKKQFGHFEEWADEEMEEETGEMHIPLLVLHCSE